MTEYQRFMEWDKDELVHCILRLNDFIKEQKKEIKKLKNDTK